MHTIRLHFFCWFRNCVYHDFSEVIRGQIMVKTVEKVHFGVRNHRSKLKFIFLWSTNFYKLKHKSCIITSLIGNYSEIIRNSSWIVNSTALQTRPGLTNGQIRSEWPIFEFGHSPIWFFSFLKMAIRHFPQSLQITKLRMVKQSRLRIRARVNSKFKLKLKFWLVIRRFHLSWIVPGEVGKFLLKISFRCSLKSRLKLKSWNELGNFKIKGFVVHATKWAEFRFESPISISKWNNWLDFRPKSENYSTVKVFSDSRPKSAQKLILKVFSDFSTQIICRLSKMLKTVEKAPITP